MKQALLLLTAGLILVGGVFIFADRAGLTQDFSRLALSFMNADAAEGDLVIPAEPDGTCKVGYGSIGNNFCRRDDAVNANNDGSCDPGYADAGGGWCLPDLSYDPPEVTIPAEFDGSCKDGYESIGNNFCQHEDARRANSNGECPSNHVDVGGGWCMPGYVPPETDEGDEEDDGGGGIDWFFPEGGFVPCGKRGDAQNPTTAVQEPCNICHAAELGQNILNFLVTTVMPFLAILFSAIGGFLIMTAGGNENRYREGRDQLVRVAVGILIVLMAWAGINFLMSTFFNEEVTGSWYEFECSVPQEPNVPDFVPDDWQGEPTQPPPGGEQPPPPPPTTGAGNPYQSGPLPAGLSCSSSQADFASYYYGSATYQPVDSPTLKAVESCIRSKLGNKVAQGGFTKEEEPAICNYRRGADICGTTCEHSQNSCHFGGNRGTQGVEAIDLHPNGITQRQLFNEIVAIKAVCNIKFVYFECSHTHVSTMSCDTSDQGVREKICN